MGTPGKVIDISDKGEGYVAVACGEGALRITALIPEGKGKMSAGDFVRGRKISLGDILE
jgi:methionyl-tRNA formyltransferase